MNPDRAVNTHTKDTIADPDSIVMSPCRRGSGLWMDERWEISPISLAQTGREARQIYSKLLDSSETVSSSFIYIERFYTIENRLFYQRRKEQNQATNRMTRRLTKGGRTDRYTNLLDSLT